MKDQAKIELTDIVFKREDVLSFINANFIHYTPIEWSKRFEQYNDSNRDHENEFYYKLNSVPNIEISKFSFFGLAVNEVFANKQADDKFALYFTCYLDQVTLDKLSLLIGSPENLLDN